MAERPTNGEPARENLAATHAKVERVLLCRGEEVIARAEPPVLHRLACPRGKHPRGGAG